MLCLGQKCKAPWPLYNQNQKTLILFNMENNNIIVQKILYFVRLSNKCHPQTSATFKLCNFPSTTPRGAYIWRGDLTEGFLRYWFVFIFGILRYLSKYVKLINDRPVFEYFLSKLRIERTVILLSKKNYFHLCYTTK